MTFSLNFVAAAGTSHITQKHAPYFPQWPATSTAVSPPPQLTADLRSAFLLTLS
jgi:hypothetical protein